MGDMSRDSILADYKASLLDSAERFTAPANGDFNRHLDAAVVDLSRLHQRILKDSITLTTADDEYPAPAGLRRVTRTLWGRNHNRAARYWDSNFVQSLPTLRAIESASGRVLQLSRLVTASELAEIGAECPYFYEAAHVIGADAVDTSVPDYDRPLLILRAQVEAMKELAMRGVGKPVALRDGVSNTPRNAHPAALADFLMQQFERGGAAYR